MAWYTWLHIVCGHMIMMFVEYTSEHAEVKIIIAGIMFNVSDSDKSPRLCLCDILYGLLYHVTLYLGVCNQDDSIGHSL